MKRFLFSLFFACTLIACSPDLPASLTDQPSAEQPATEDPAAEQPSTEQPPVDEPSVEEPATEDPGLPATPMNPATDCLTGAFVLNEGNMGDPGSLIFISDDGAVTESAFAAANPGLTLGAQSQDLFQYDDKIYVVAQNSSKLLSIDASTLKLERSFGACARLSSPTNVAVLDPSNVFIRTREGIFRFDTTTPTTAPTLVQGSADAEQNRMAVVCGRVFAARGKYLLVLEAGQNAVVAKWDLGGPVTGVLKADEQTLWVAVNGVAGSQSSIAKIDARTGTILRKNEFSEKIGAVGSSSSIGAYRDLIYFSPGSQTALYRHDFQTGVTEKWLDARDIETDAVKKYNGIAVNPRTGCVWMTTIKGFGTAYLTNNILVFDPSAPAALTANYRNLTRFPAGIFFTR